jgi:peroxiredoxin
LGYQIIAISPDAPASLKVTNDKEKLNYLLLSDSTGELKSMGIAFQAQENLIIAKGSDGVNNSFFAVPAVFLLNVNTEIEFEHIKISKIEFQMIC